MNDDQPRRRVRVDLEELRFAMENASYEQRYFLDIETGDVILLSEWSDDDDTREMRMKIDEAEPGRYLEVPRAESHDGYQDMQAFIETISDERLRELLYVAIQGRGAFRRFKDVLVRHPVEQERWFDFQQARQDVRAREWLADDGYEPE